MASAGTMRGTPKGQNKLQSFNSSSSIPRPHSETSHASPSHTTQSETGASTLSSRRQQQSKRDEAIRLKAEKDLSKRKHTQARARSVRKAPPGTVLALKPSPALQIKPSTTVAEAAQMMAAKREDCVLVTDEMERIAGIFTAKDLAFRVVGAGIKPREILVSEIMTKNPLCAKTDTSATEALELMVKKGFRHLPVMDENHDIFGTLDITKCFYEAMEKLERAYNSSSKLYEAMHGVQKELGSTQPQQIMEYVDSLRAKMAGPTLESTLNGLSPATVSVRTTVKDAATIMKDNRTTAVLVQDHGQITGIFTSKDVVLRVVAVGLDPNNCSVVRVMTPHPDFAPMEMSIQDGLRKMHDGHYLNLPVTNGEGGEIIGIVDVLKLTYATLDQINTMQTGDGENPAWQKFWLAMDGDTESAMSAEGSRPPQTPLSRSGVSPEMSRPDFERGNSLMPNDSASQRGDDSPERSAIAGVIASEDIPFAFKFKAPSGRMHRLQVTAAAGIAEFVDNVAAKLGAELEAVGGEPSVDDGKLGKSGFALSYLDNEGDTVSITTDQDLLEAITMAQKNGKEKVDLFVHDPEKAPLPATLDPHPGFAAPPTPADSMTMKQRRKQMVEEEHDTDEEDVAPKKSMRNRQGQEQVIAGVPNELLLPGAVAALAVVIVGVFAFSRAGNR